MRNGQNKRMRGRNRKSQNPMTRVFESNGPDVKIRGTPSHIAEKYLQLARDAQSSGDPVAAENYYQHAEHYFRLIAAAQEQFRQTNPQFYRGENERDMRDDGFDDGDDIRPQGMPGPGEVPFGPGEPQPYLPREPQPYPAREQQVYQPREQREPREHREQQTYAPRPQPQPHRRPRRWATSTGCPPSSPADSRRNRSRASRGLGKTATKTRAIASPCTGAGAGTAARATRFRARRTGGGGDGGDNSRGNE